MERRSRAHPLLTVTLLALGALLLATAAGAAAPAGKNYAITLLIADPETRELDPSPGCLSFSSAAEGEVCTESDDCGTWEFVERKGRRNSWQGEITLENQDGEQVVVEFYGNTDRKGPRSSIGATIFATVEGVEVNGGMGGTQTSLSTCLEFGLSDDG